MSFPNIKSLFFDVGDTLAYRYLPYEQALADASKKFGYSPDESKLLEAKSVSAEYYKKNRQNFKSVEEIQQFIFLFSKLILDVLNIKPQDGDTKKIIDDIDYLGATYYRLFPEVLGVLDILGRKFGIMAIVSNWNIYLEDFCKVMRIKDYFDFIVVSDIVGVWKPAPKIFEIAIKNSGCAPDEIVYIGNSYEEDIVGARGVGIQPILIDRNNNYPDADCCKIKNLTELNELLGEKAEKRKSRKTETLTRAT